MRAPKGSVCPEMCIAYRMDVTSLKSVTRRTSEIRDYCEIIMKNYSISKYHAPLNDLFEGPIPMISRVLTSRFE